jgi:hypothetical protein
MSLTSTEQAIYDHVKGALPPWFFALDHADEFMGALVKVFDAVRSYREMLVNQCFILDADNGTPDWLGELAKDRGASQQLGESTEQLRQRLRAFPDAVTTAAVKAVVDALLAADGVSGECTLLDLRPNRGWWGSYTSLTGTGGVIAAGPGAFQFGFTPTSPPKVLVKVGDLLQLSGCPSPGNDGLLVITSIVGNEIRYTFASGSPESAPACSWAWVKTKPGPEHAIRDGHPRFFYGRGYRYGRDRHTLVIMLPYGTDAGLAASVRTMLTNVKAAGVNVIVERRLSP